MTTPVSLLAPRPAPSGCGQLVGRAALSALFLLAALLPGSAPGQQAQPPATRTELVDRLSNHVNQARFDPAVWGVKIVSLDSGETWFEHNAGKLLSPASNSKLYTMAAVLDRLGEDYRIRTSLYARKPPTARGTLEGDLVVFGRGDPSFNTRLHGGSIRQALEPLVAALAKAGVRRIAGDLVADDSFFRGPEFGSGWTWDDSQYYYGAELSALTINDNLVQVLIKPGKTEGAPCALTLQPAAPCLVLSNRTVTTAPGTRRDLRFYRPLGGNIVYVSGALPLDDAGYTEDLTVHRPALLFACWFRDALERRGIKVRGKTRVAGWLDADKPRQTAVELGAVDSPALRDLVREVQKPSQNLYTDLLLAHLGEVRRRAGAGATATSEDLGIAELEAFLQEIGIARADVRFEEGSGLSRNNLNTANATVQLLTHMARHRAAEAYTVALPIAGVDGTLRRRMQGTPAMNNVRAKTGTLRWANSLSGYVTTAGGERLAFSLMLNRYYNPGAPVSARAELDAIAVLLAGYGGH